MKNIKKNMTILLISIIVISIITLTMSIFVFLLLNKNDFISTILAILSIIFVIILLKLNEKFEYLRHNYNLEGLINQSETPFKINKNFTIESLSNHLIKNHNYIHHLNSNNFIILYKFENTNKKRRQSLKAILIYKQNIKFNSYSSNNAFEKLENELSKNNKYFKRSFIQFKIQEKSIDENNIEEANEIFFINHRKNNISLNNVIYSKKDKEIYFLHSKTFKPLNILNETINEIKMIIK